MDRRTDERLHQDVSGSEPIIVAPEKGEKLTAKGASCTFKVTSALTNDRLGIYEIVLQPQTTGADLHYHRFMDETFIVMKGVVTIQMEDREMEVTEGSIVHVPRFTPHGFSNNSVEEVKIMLVFNPGQQREGFFYGLFDHLNNETMDSKSLAQLNKRFDTVLIKQ